MTDEEIVAGDLSEIEVLAALRGAARPAPAASGRI